MSHRSDGHHPQPHGEQDAPALTARLARCTGLMSAGDYAACTPLAMGLHAEAVAAGERALAAKAALLLAKVHANLAQHDQACTWADAAIEMGQAAEAGTLAQSWMVRGSSTAVLGQPARAVRHLDRAVSLLGDNPPADVASAVFNGVGLTYMTLGMPLQALAAHRRAIEANRGYEAPTRLRMRINLLYAAGAAHDLLGAIRQDEADDVIESVRNDIALVESEARAVGSLMARAGYLHSVGALLRRIGRAQEACVMLEELRALIPQLPGPAYEALINLALAQRAAGMPGRAELTQQEARRSLPAIDPARPDAKVLRFAYQLAELEGRPAEAMALFRRYHALVVRNEHAAFEARMAELGATVHMLSLRHENAELRRLNDGLSMSYSQASTLAATDALTGVGNRRALETAYGAITCAGRALSVLMLDLDHFKAINDQHSHVIGDRVLRAVAALLGQTLRNGDVLGRYGGEEFTVLLADAGPDAAWPAAERLRLAVEQADWAAVAPGLQVTLSGGVAHVRDGEGFGAAIERADALLYRAKRDGRNQILGEAAAMTAAHREGGPGGVLQA